MKTLIIALIAIVTAAAAGGARAATLAPELRKLVIDAAYENCSLGRALSVEVESVQVSEQTFDQGQTDYLYDIVLDVTRTKINDADELLSDKISVRAAEYAVSNPSVEKYKVLSVRSDSKICD